MVKVVRSGKSREISIHGALVGDVMHLEPGDVVPVDGIFISGHSVKCDESSTTGELDVLKKQGAHEVFRAIESGADARKLDPFIISGSRVSESTGTFVVTAVGVNSTHGKAMMALREGAEATPLQQKLNVLAEYIAKLGGAAALLLFVVDLIKFCVQLKGSTSTASEKGQEFLRILIVSVTVVVVAVLDSLPLAVTLALAFTTTRMLKDNNLVRVLRSCETMGNAMTVCSDKTGMLTQNKMTMVAATIGMVVQLGDTTSTTTTSGGNAEDKEIQADEKPVVSKSDPTQIDTSEFLFSLSPEVKEILVQSIATKSTAFEGVQDGQPTFIGSKTETALLSFARDHLGMDPVAEERFNADVVQVVPFDSGRKCMASVVRLRDGRFRMHAKGASEILLQKCTRIIRDPRIASSETRLTEENVETLDTIISAYASRSLRTIALLYRDFEQWPPEEARMEEDPNEARFGLAFKVFFGVVGIKDPLREGVKEAVRACQAAGVFVLMVTGDNIATARAIVEECGMYKPDTRGLIMEGQRLRTLTEELARPDNTPLPGTCSIESKR
jgi:Ca2+-transporting ATPase